MPLEYLKHCPICNTTSFSNYLNVEDYTVSHKEFTIQQCNTCNFLLTNPRPTEEEIGAYYQSSDYISHHDEAKDLMSSVYISVRDYTINQKIKLINRLSPKKGSLLDIGCGTGNFIQAVKKDGWKISGTEPDPGARTVASSRVGDLISEGISVPQLSEKSFDVITLWHVLEHIHQLNESLTWVKNHLNEDGTIVIAVPNPQSHDAKKYGRFWAAYDVPRHLYHFTRATMKTLLEKHDLTITQILPMWFDSFYVSMLSSKYQADKLSLWTGLKTGLISNLKGKSGEIDKINTSSLIYIVKKK
jgi:2-polyprenyl-3-methyl-5-hydroxy-6-metoxy-1,4-benzoquinol methylase